MNILKKLIAILVVLIPVVVNADTRCSTDHFGDTMCRSADGTTWRGSAKYFGNETWRDNRGNTIRSTTDYFENKTDRDNSGNSYIKKKKHRTALDEFNALVAEIYRPLLVNNKNLPDEKILEIVQTVVIAFKQAAESKGDKISGMPLLSIAAKFVVVFDEFGDDLFLEHLKYEINRYLTSSLREEYKGCFYLPVLCLLE